MPGPAAPPEWADAPPARNRTKRAAATAPTRPRMRGAALCVRPCSQTKRAQHKQPDLDKGEPGAVHLGGQDVEEPHRRAGDQEAHDAAQRRHPLAGFRQQPGRVGDRRQQQVGRRESDADRGEGGHDRCSRLAQREADRGAEEGRRAGRRHQGRENAREEVSGVALALAAAQAAADRLRQPESRWRYRPGCRPGHFPSRRCSGPASRRARLFRSCTCRR